MSKVFYLVGSDDGVEAARKDMALFVRAWNSQHRSQISTVDFRLMDDDGTLFPAVFHGSLSYRDIYPKGR